MGRAEGEAHERRSSGHGNMLLVVLVFHLVIRHAIPKRAMRRRWAMIGLLIARTLSSTGNPVYVHRRFGSLKDDGKYIEDIQTPSYTFASVARLIRPK
jgi:hypothetical protein